MVDPASPQPEGEASAEPAPEEKRREASRRRAHRMKVLAPLVFLMLALVYTFATNLIPSHSMEPALKPGDHILALKAWIAYPMGRNPSRGDIVTFLEPDAALEDAEPGPDGKKPKPSVLIKRVVGLPGETIELFPDGVHVNGQPLRADFTKNYIEPVFFGATYGALGPVKLKEDEIFVMGDNVGESDDSRHWGPLKKERLIGRFLFVLFSEGEGGINEQRTRHKFGDPDAEGR
jgi:signal peptidase I